MTHVEPGGWRHLDGSTCPSYPDSLHFTYIQGGTWECGHEGGIVCHRLVDLKELEKPTYLFWNDGVILQCELEQCMVEVGHAHRPKRAVYWTQKLPHRCTPAEAQVIFDEHVAAHTQESA